MTAKLYVPDSSEISVELSPIRNGYSSIHVIEQVSKIFECTPELVDVLAIDTNYVVYSVFDSEGPANFMATRAVAELTGIDFDTADEDELLRGPVLIVRE